MPQYHFLPVLAAIAFLLAGMVIIARAAAGPGRGMWLIPATLSAALFGWSVWTVALEGPLGFWSEHLRDAWGNQIWFDLLLSMGTAFALLAPRAKARGMRLAPWFVAIACTGSVGLLAMAARYLFLRETAPAARHTPA
ncbi:hypothetical protein [Novosphingobium sp.]|uniref:hypothetical protein n=1 Tax=Novosphingobium sp. TaxID=1874826 RepID=UPI0025FFF64A|nr:hypothetical protein [Novosphingobium sp.]